MAKRSGTKRPLTARQNSPVHIEALSFGSLMNALRSEMDLTQTALANRLKRSTSFVSLLETGQRSPSREFIDELAEALELPQDSDQKRQLIQAAGFEPGEISGVLERIVNAIAEQTHMSESNRLLLHADLGAQIEGWTEYFRNQKRYEQGLFDDTALHYEQLLHRRHYSPTLNTCLQISLAETFVQSGELSRAETLAKNARARVEDLEVAPDRSPTLGAEIRALQGLIFVHNGNYPMGKALLEQSVTIYQKLLTSGHVSDDVGYIGLGSSYKRLAQVALLQGEPEGALTYCITAEAYLYRANPSVERNHWLLRTAEQRAWAYAKLGDFTQAIALRKHTREEFAKVHDDYALTRNSLYTGDDYLGQIKSQVKKALNELSVGVTDRTGLKRRADAIRRALSAPSIRELIESAECCYRDAKKGFEGSGQNILMGRCLSNLGIILRYKALLVGDMSLLNDAQNLLVDALSLEQGIGHWRRLPGIYEALADLAVDRMSLSGAQFYYGKALEALDSLLVRSADTAAAAQRERIFTGLQVVNAHLKEAQPSRRLLGVFGAEKWQSICERLVDLILGFVMQNQHANGLIALSNREDSWIERIYALDSEEGGRTLVQNRLSDALALKVPAGLSPVGVGIHQLRHKQFTQVIENAHGTTQDLSRDICSRLHVERSIANSDTFELTHEQVSNALHFLTAYPQGYQLNSSVYEVPLGYEVKRSHVLIEVPDTLAPLFDSREEVKQHKVTLCYEFDDDALARSLLGIAREFADMCVAMGDQAPKPEPTDSWLQRLRDKQTVYAGIIKDNIFLPSSRQVASH